MKALRDFGVGVGALLLVLGFIVSTLVPERLTYALPVTLLGLLVMAAGLAADRQRVLAFLSGRRGRAAGASLGYALVVLAVVVLVNFLAGRHNRRFDLTANKAFSLSEQTIKVLESLPRDVSLTVFFRESEPERQKLQDLLAEYRYHARKLDVRFIDPDLNPGEVKRYGITEDGTIVAESAGQETRVTASDEESITNALIKVTSDRAHTVYFVTGHGERDPGDTGRDGLSILKAALEKQQYTVKTLTLNQGVPADATELVIPGPEKPLLEAEVTMIEAYLDRGGRLLLLWDPGTAPGLDPVLARYGAAVRHDVVIDKISQLFGGDARIPLVPADGYDASHEVTRNFRYQTFYPMASSIAIDDKLPEGVTATRLAQTSEYSWGETSQQEVKSGQITMDEGVDHPGPITVGAALVRKEKRVEAPGVAAPDKAEDDQKVDTADADSAPTPESRVLVFGDSDFLGNSYFNASGNGDLGLSGIAWLADQGELVSIRPKTASPSIIVLTSQQALFYLWTIVALGPVGICIVGVGVWVRRRRL